MLVPTVYVTYATVPLLVPAAPEVIVIQAALLVAVHAQPAVALTGIEPLPPAAGNVALEESSVGVQIVVKDQTAETFAPSVPLAPMAQ